MLSTESNVAGFLSLIEAGAHAIASAFLFISPITSGRASISVPASAATRTILDKFSIFAFMGFDRFCLRNAQSKVL